MTHFPPEPVAVALVAAANVTIDRLPRRAAVPVALGWAAVLTWVAWRAGASWRGMGMDPADLRTGLRWGMGASLPVAAGLVAGVALPRARRVLADRDAVESGPDAVRYRLLIEIPLGTALSEEVMFRGALHASLARRLGRPAAAAVTSALFGLWHVLPTREQLRTHPSRGAVRGRESLVVAATVAVTGLAGAWFWWLRDRSGSLVAPVVVHAVGNASSFLAGRAAARMLGLRTPG